MEEKEVKAALEGAKNEILAKQSEIEKAVATKASQQTIDDLKSDFSKRIDALQEQADDLATKSARLNQSTEAAQRKSLTGLTEESVVKLKEELKAKGLGLKDLFKGAGVGLGKEIDIDLKAVSNMTTGYALTGSNANIMRAFDTEAGVSKDPTAPLFITDLITTGTTDAQTIYWVERVLVEGGAAQVAEAALFPQISAKYSKFSANAKKTAAYAKVTEEAVEDVDYILSEIQSEIVEGPASIRVQLENQILTGDGTGENHNGLFTQATAFALPTGFTKLTAPTLYDAGQAAILQVTKNNFVPSHLLVNPSDLVNMQLVKDANGNYVMPPFIGQNGMVIGGVRIAANNRIAEGSYLVGDMKRATLFMKRALTLKFFDQNENDALTDLRTITGSVRAILRLKGPDKKAFVKGTFAATKTAITAP